MKVFAAILLGLVASVVALPTASESEHRQAFGEFMTKYNKEYATMQEQETRFGHFVYNMGRIAVLNAAEESDVYGVTPFADMSEEEFAAAYLSPVNMAEIPVHNYTAGKQVSFVDTSSAPDSFDWRSKGAVTPVKNQGQCGSCWSFSTTGNIEGQWFLSKGKLVSLSEQELVDCDTVDQGCNGGLPSNAYQQIMKIGGLETESEYPYKGVGGSCNFEKSDVAATVSGWKALPKDEDQLAAWLAQNGPISIGINAGPMQLYHGGISKPWKIFCNPTRLDHGVLLVGYGEENGTKFWTIKNSWGSSWGEKGYYRIIRGTGACGLNTMATSAEV